MKRERDAAAAGVSTPVSDGDGSDERPRKIRTQSTVFDMPSEVLKLVVDSLDIVSAVQLLSTCRSLRYPSGGSCYLEVRNDVHNLIQTLRYNQHICLLATPETIRNNEEHGLRLLTRVANEKDAELCNEIAPRRIGELRAECKAQTKHIVARMEKYRLFAAVIQTFGLGASEPFDHQAA